MKYVLIISEKERMSLYTEIFKIRSNLNIQMTNTSDLNIPHVCPILKAQY